ncbi:uncharacterized protein METZ01_LOCUS382773 [marine metagenome]|uniref:Uncharacterized protein n=1 Tax=marine metagenome TaxID=408172 RepID=A0A382U6I5_9ZZZZ
MLIYPIIGKVIMFLIGTRCLPFRVTLRLTSNMLIHEFAAYSEKQDSTIGGRFTFS